MKAARDITLILRLDLIAGIIDKWKETCDFNKIDTRLFIEDSCSLDFGKYATRYFQVVQISYFTIFPAKY